MNIWSKQTYPSPIFILFGSVGCAIFIMMTVALASATSPAVGTITFIQTSDVAIAEDLHIYAQYPASYGHQYAGQWRNEAVDAFNQPRDIAVDAEGTVYVADTMNHHIQKFAADGTYLYRWGSLGVGPNRLNEPKGVAVTNDGHIAVADYGNARIQIFTAFGTQVRSWGELGTAVGNFDHPEGVAVAPNGDVYVADTGNDRIQYFTVTGGYRGSWGSLGTGNGQFDFPTNLAISAEEEVYVVDTFNHRVQKFSLTGGFLGAWGSVGSGAGQFSYPTGIAIDSEGYVYVTESGNNRVQKFDKHGNYITQWGSAGSSSGQFNQPIGLEVNLTGDVLVADRNNNRVQRFNAPVPVQMALDTDGSDGDVITNTITVTPPAGSYQFTLFSSNGWLLIGPDCVSSDTANPPTVTASQIHLNLVDGANVTCTLPTVAASEQAYLSVISK